jgi:predicted MPP superfamily phosphohydrolase
LTRVGRRRLALASACLALAGLAGWSVLVVPDQLVVTTTTIVLPRWPRAQDGLRVIAISDVHAGSPYVDVLKLRALVALTNAQQPDLVALLGDYVIQGVAGGTFIAPETTASELGALRARLGVYAVLGNHDHWLDGPRVKRAFMAAGIAVIDDEVRPVRTSQGELWLVGIHDIWTGWPDVRSLLRGVPTGPPTLALTHNPDIFPSLPPGIDLLLAGHTHGGQVRLPLLGSLIVPSSYGQRYALGHVVESGRHLFVTPGVGTSIVPIRFRVPPEISLLILKSVSAGGG